MNIHVSRIARWQAAMGGYASEASPSPPPLVAFESKDDADDGDVDDASGDDDGNASSTDEMST